MPRAVSLRIVVVLALCMVAVVAGCSRQTTQALPSPPIVAAQQHGSDAGSDDGASVATSVASGVAPPQVDPPGVYMGRTIAAPMSYQGADWLDRADRDATQKPEHVLDVLAIKEGQTVADVGCGSGYFTVRLSRRVGPTGRVIATDLQQEMLDLLKKKLDAAKIQNVTSKLTTAEDAKLPPAGELDLVLMVDVYHELPNPPRTLAQVASALKATTGRLALVEYRAEDPKVAIKPEHKTTLVQLRRELEANGFVFIASDESLPEQRIVQFKPPPVPPTR